LSAVISHPYPGHSKAVRQRLIALDDTMPVPKTFEEVLNWLANKPSSGEAVKTTYF
jgi:hypothetical protein